MNVPNAVPISCAENDDITSTLRSLPMGSDSAYDDLDNTFDEYDILSQGDLNPKSDLERRENNLMHESFKSSMNSTVRIEITDDDRMSVLAASAILRKCKQQVFLPYSKLLLVIGWRPFGREHFNYHCGWKMLNIVYPVFIMALLFYTYAYEILACQGNLDIHRPVTISPITTQPLGEFNVAYKNLSSSVHDMSLGRASLRLASHAPGIDICNHVITEYIVPSFLHFLSFCLGFYYFRIQDSEQMYALIEQVLLLVTPLPRGVQTQTDMIRYLRCILLLGGIWILFTLTVQGIFFGAFGFEDISFEIPGIPRAWNIALLCIDIFGFLIVNCINAAVVVNYAVQCETIMLYTRSVKDQLFEKSAQLQNIMHDLYRVWQAILRLNGTMSKMNSLCMFYFAERIILGVCLLILNEDTHPMVWVYRSLFPIMWLVIFCIPLIQARRVNSILEELREVSIEARVFGYQNSPVDELDSFQQFIANGKFRVRLMCVPVKASYIYGSLILIAFILIVLAQTGVFTNSMSFF